MLVTAVMLEQQVTKNFGAATLNSDSDLEIRESFLAKILPVPTGKLATIRNSEEQHQQALLLDICPPPFGKWMITSGQDQN